MANITQSGNKLQCNTGRSRVKDLCSTSVKEFV